MSCHLWPVPEENNTLMDTPTSEEPLWVPSGMCRWIKWGKLTGKTALQPPVCKEALKSPGCGWKGRSNTVVVVKGQPTLTFHSQRTGLLYKENNVCKFSSRNLVTAKHQKAKGTGKFWEQHKGTNSIKVHGNSEQAQEAEFLLSKVRVSWSMKGESW